MRYYFLTDGRGNVGGLMNSGGTSLVAQYRYTPFGDSAYTSGTLSNAIQFAGRELDPDTKLYYNRARYYDPKLGRFLSEDPIRLAGGINQYAYAGSDPINNSDPSGLAYYDCVAWGWFYWDGAAEKWVLSGPSWWECHYVPTFGPDPWNNLLWEGMSGGLPVDPLDVGQPAGQAGPSCPAFLREPGVEAAWSGTWQRARQSRLEEAAVGRVATNVRGQPLYSEQVTQYLFQSAAETRFVVTGAVAFLAHAHILNPGDPIPGRRGMVAGPRGVSPADSAGSRQLGVPYVIVDRDSLYVYHHGVGSASCPRPY